MNISLNSTHFRLNVNLYRMRHHASVNFNSQLNSSNIHDSPPHTHTQMRKTPNKLNNNYGIAIFAILYEIRRDNCNRFKYIILI